jgi:hypothetical protein
MGKSFQDMTVTQLREKLRNKNMKVSGNKDELIQRLRKGKAIKVPDNVENKKLYREVVQKVKQRVKVWPSAYASGQVVSEYKKEGGKYKGEQNSSLGRWYKEKWVNVCKPKGGGYEKCGRSKSKIKDYPYCRPSVRVNSKTPMTVAELKEKYGKEKLENMCKKKRKQGLPKGGKPTRITK